MARPSLPLPPAPLTLPATAGGAAADFLAWTWRGPVLLASVSVRRPRPAGVPLPCGLDVLAAIALFGYAA